MKMNKKILALLGSGHGIVDLSQGALPMILTFLTPVFGLSQMQVGITMLFFNLSSSVIQPLFGILSDRYRAGWMIPLGCILAGLGLAATGYATSYPVLMLAALVCGFGVASYHPEGSKFARYASGEKKASGMAVYSVGGNFGLAAGPVLAGFFYGIGGLKGMAGFLVLYCLMAVLLWANLGRVSVLEEKNPAVKKSGDGLGKRGAVYYLPVLILVLVIIMRSWTHLGLVTFLPQYYVHFLHHSRSWAAAITSLYLLAGAFGTIVGGPLADRWGLKRVMIISLACMVPLLLLIGSSRGPLGVVAVILAGFVVISTFAVTVVFGQELLPDNVGIASGLTLGFAIGMGGIGATILGWVADHWGLPFMFRSMIIFPIIGLALTFFLPGRKALTERKEKFSPGS